MDERDKNKRQLWERDYKEESKENGKERESGYWREKERTGMIGMRRKRSEY